MLPQHHHTPRVPLPKQTDRERERERERQRGRQRAQQQQRNEEEVEEKKRLNGERGDCLCVRLYKQSIQFGRRRRHGIDITRDISGLAQRGGGT